MSQIIHPESPGRLRRFIAYPLTLLVIGFAAITATAIGVGALYQQLGFDPNTPQMALGAPLVAAVVILAYKAIKRWIERTPDKELELAGALPELGAGLLIGFTLFTAVTAIAALLGGFEVLGWRGGAGGIWTWLAIAVVSAVLEETLFRGILQRHLEAVFGSWIALAITSALFGLGHIFNPDASLFAAFAIAVEAGILLGAAYMLTRRLWLAIGIHAAWNFTQGWVFSVPVSGGEVPLGLLVTRRNGPDWLTGGDFGLEASVVAIVVASLAGLLMLRRALSNGQVVAPSWRR